MNLPYVVRICIYLSIFLSQCSTNTPAFLLSSLLSEKDEEAIEKYKKKTSTNACENINRQLEDRRIKCGRYSQSIEVVDINFYLIWGEFIKW